jgi:small-conductance mechanosensitive channel
LHHAVVAGLVGLVFLGSVAIGRPLLLIIARRVAANSGQQAAIRRRIEGPGVRQTMTRLTLYIGIVALVDALLQAALALYLPTSSFLVATTVVHIAVVACAVALALLVIWLRLRSTV